jgi:hypothetical protein
LQRTCILIQKASNTSSIPALFVNQNAAISCKLNVKISHLEVLWVYIFGSSLISLSFNSFSARVTEEML